MAAEAKALQGSLFGTKEEHPSDISASTQELGPLSEESLSDEQLLLDSQKRPRKRKESESDKSESLEVVEVSNEIKPDDDLPAWSHQSLVDINQLTPVLRHYVELKRQSPERILLYRLGDFFECFFEDAIRLSQLLELTLTAKDAGKNIGRVPMAGIPHHASDRYCRELINRGLSVALCDQLETTPSKGLLLKRDITRVLTPGTIIEEGMLQSRRNNWLAAVIFEEMNSKDSFLWGLATADVSTGEFQVTQREGVAELFQELNTVEASELIWPGYDIENKGKWCPERLSLTPVSNTSFNHPDAEIALKNQYKLKTIDGLGLQEVPLAMRAAGALVSYLQKTKPIDAVQNSADNATSVPLDFPTLFFDDDYLVLDAQTRRNLELTSTQRDNQFYGSLLWAVDQTYTAMGGRCLRRWLEAPLMEVNAIIERQLIVSKLVELRPRRNAIRRLLRSMGDLERLAGRAGAGQASARDLVAIANGLERLPRLAKQLEGLFKNPSAWMKWLLNVDPQLKQLAHQIRFTLLENPPLSLTDGALIHDGIDPILDGLRNKLDDQESWLSHQEESEKKLSGIMNLKLQYHRTFGYFLSVTKSKASNVPSHWIRRQTLSNEERFITPTLKEREGKIFQLKVRICQREYELFCQLRQIVGHKTEAIRKVARSIAALDALAGLAELAATSNYCEPQILGLDHHDSRILKIEASRHPVVEKTLVEDIFQPNDIHLGEGADLIILTGPNASGKSCYLRQIALIQILAQIGSWVPAKTAYLSITDRIFTRVGAVDDLATGQSTFMVEMAETASILNQATNKSLVILDEIGRGTATFDGLSIAWAVSEFLASNICCRTIFATHYHELNELSKVLNNVRNFQVLVDQTGNELVFLHRVSSGGASKSYGIEVARLAGVPNLVVDRARKLLHNLEKDNSFQHNFVSKY